VIVGSRQGLVSSQVKDEFTAIRCARIVVRKSGSNCARFILRGRYVPPALSDTGKRKRKFFETKKLAEAECERLEARRDNFGVSLTAMTPARIAEASEAYKLLDPHHIGLLDAVRGFLDDHKQTANGQHTLQPAL
jgi:hypothetical protein